MYILAIQRSGKIRDRAPNKMLVVAVYYGTAFGGLSYSYNVEYIALSVDDTKYITSLYIL